MPLWILIIYVGLASVGVEAKLLDSKKNALRRNIEVRAVNTSDEMQPAGSTYNPAYVLGLHW